VKQFLANVCKKDNALNGKFVSNITLLELPLRGTILKSSPSAITASTECSLYVASIRIFDEIPVVVVMIGSWVVKVSPIVAGTGGIGSVLVVAVVVRAVAAMAGILITTAAILITTALKTTTLKTTTLLIVVACSCGSIVGIVGILATCAPSMSFVIRKRTHVVVGEDGSAVAAIAIVVAIAVAIVGFATIIAVSRVIIALAIVTILIASAVVSTATIVTVSTLELVVIVWRWYRSCL
jgi:hypothetical protein